MDSMPDHLSLPDGRRLDTRVSGPADGLPLVFHHGTPGSAVPERFIERAAHERGLRVVATSRPGYGDSTPQVGRSVVDVVADTSAVLAAIGASRCVVAGWSGGGPHALACAARLQEAAAVLVIAGVAPHGVADLDWASGMGEYNVSYYEAYLKGEESARAVDEELREEALNATTADIVSYLATVLPEVDEAVLTDEFAEDTLADLREALRVGIQGSLDDNYAFLKPWGFELSEISVPTMIWHGSADLMVPFAHGEWLAAHVPGASAHLVQGEGHLSLPVRAIDRMLDELITASSDS